MEGGCDNPKPGQYDPNSEQFSATKQARRVSEMNDMKTKIKTMNVNVDDISGSEGSKMIAPEMEDQLKQNQQALDRRTSEEGMPKDPAELVIPRKRFGIFTISPVSLMKWTKGTLKHPLSDIGKELDKDALRCFAAIQRYMKDKPASQEGKGDQADIRLVADRGMCVVGLRTELYLQVMKQLTDNPSRQSYLKGWEILCIITNCFAPPVPLALIVQRFLEKEAFPQEKVTELLTDFKWKELKGKELEDAKLGLMAKYALQKFRHTMRTPKGRVPSVEEIEHFCEAPFKFNVFGEALENIVLNSENVDEASRLPKVLSFLAEAVLLLGGHASEGIFRVPGDLDGIISLKMRIERGDYNLEGVHDAAVAASLLKMWVRELEEPLIPNRFYSRCLEIHEVQAAMDVVDELPQLNRSCIKYLAKYLQVVGDPVNQPKTKMSVSNLAIVFAPNLLRCPTDNPFIILQNSKREQRFVKIIVNYLDE